MYPLGRIGITLFLGRFFSGKVRFKMAVQAINPGINSTRLLDKPLGLLGVGVGRSFFIA